MRLTADADANLWIPVTQSLGFTGRRHRKAAIRMLLGQANAAMGAVERPGSKFGAWMMSQAAPLLMKRADGRVLVWTWRSEPELVVAMATTQALTPEVRIARASMPMDYDDTESFSNRWLGVGEKLVVAMPPTPSSPPFASYTWDTGTHLVTLTAICSDRERFGTLAGALDDLARSIRVVDEITGGESPEVLRLDPA
ncbi:hypothetical protein [Streptomyces sp. AC495_CC817]|uniref:hypothetical protein n=1 Tax=Streptomyces sp. AC495_CC817 TaxID=2823900 RepID=UPI001C277B62|nr:hypothetical protein [Streptomyces sp. AC495_CC817]